MIYLLLSLFRFPPSLRTCINFHFLDAIDTVKDKANAKADLVKESLEKSKAFAGSVLNSTATLASQKLEKGAEFASSVNQKVHQVIADKASLAGDAKEAVVAKSKAGAEAFGGFVTGMVCWQCFFGKFLAIPLRDSLKF